MKFLFVFFLVINCIFSLTAQNIKNEENAKCRMTEAYPPPQERELPWYSINLDLDPKERWKEVTIAFRDGIEALINQVLIDWTSKLVTDVLSAITNNEDEILDRFPNGYGDEIRGISMYGNLSLDVLILYNVMYEVEGLCTSIVAQNTSGHVIHGRNLDFGLFMGFNWTDRQWEVTQELRGILFNAIFYKNNVEVFRGVWYAGYVGLLTGMKHLGFSITVDTREDNNFDKYLIEWFKNPNDNSQFLTFTTRTVMESISNYDDAVANLTTTPFIGPCYIIIGGYQYNEGAVLTMGPNLTLVDLWPIPKALPMNSTTKWYVLETNYDHWKQPPWFDDRRYPAEACMNEIGENNIALPTLYNVLNGKPNRNRLTTYTALMDVANNHLESYLQYCDDLDCPPW